MLAQKPQVAEPAGGLLGHLRCSVGIDQAGRCAASGLLAAHVPVGRVDRRLAGIEGAQLLGGDLAALLGGLVDGAHLGVAAGLHADRCRDLVAALAGLTAGKLAGSVGRPARRGAAVASLALLGPLALDGLELVGLAHALRVALHALAVELDEGRLLRRRSQANCTTMTGTLGKPLPVPPASGGDRRRSCRRFARERLKHAALARCLPQARGRLARRRRWPGSAGGPAGASSWRPWPAGRSARGEPPRPAPVCFLSQRPSSPSRACGTAAQ